MTRLLLVACAMGLCLLAQGCAGGLIGRYDLASDIPEDQAALNDAYGRSVNGQILLNVLRSRDRWPRHYTVANAMNDQPTITVRGTGILNTLDLNNAIDPYRNSQLQGYREEATRPSYGVTPLDAEAINRAVLSPTPRPIFAHYWDSEWPRDVLLLVMVDRITLYGKRGRISDQNLHERNKDTAWGVPIANRLVTEAGQACTLGGSAIDISAWASATDSELSARLRDITSECAYFRLAHAIANYAYAHPGRVRLRGNPDPQCTRSGPIDLTRRNAALLESMVAAATAEETLRVEIPRPATPGAAVSQVVLASCRAQDNHPVVLEILRPLAATATSDDVVASFFVELRSLDAMVYAMGEVLRTSPRTIGRETVIGFPELARAPDCRTQTCPLIPLFQVAPSNTRMGNGQRYAAVVRHINMRYYAGSAAPSAPDRAATVLTLLTQLSGLNRSPGTLTAAPVRPVIN